MRIIGTCPFCGGYSDLVRKSKTIVHGIVRHTTYVECKACHCRGKRFLLDEYETPKIARQKAIDSWNNRSNTTVYIGVDNE